MNHPIEAAEPVSLAYTEANRFNSLIQLTHSRIFSLCACVSLCLSLPLLQTHIQNYIKIK